MECFFNITREVSIHAPARGATIDWSLPCPSIFVSIHAPARGATATASTSVPSATVSIHAPARGATRGQSSLFPHHGKVSIHAPARGATNPWPLQWIQRLLFQSTHPRGVRQSEFVRRIGAKEVSIHAPARGATTSIC